MTATAPSADGFLRVVERVRWVFRPGPEKPARERNDLKEL